jgi:penicillin amidase
MPRWIKRLAWGLAGLTALVLLGAVGYAWRATPAHGGELKLRGLAGEVRIERDNHGIPTVRAASLRDAMYGLGVVHAQDRLWQLETHRRIGSGRLAEAFGAGALDTDRFLRALGVRRAAQAQWERTSGEAREVLEAYAAGVNAGIGQASWALPPEFLVLGVKPEPWTPVDSLAWALMMAWDLGGNWNAELARLRLASRLPLERLNQIVPPYPGGAPARCVGPWWTCRASRRPRASRARARTTGSWLALAASPAARCWPTTRTCA